MKFSKTKAKWLYQRRKSLLGYYRMKDIGKNKAADVFYRNALDKEMGKFIDSAFSDIKSKYGALTPVTVRKINKELTLLLGAKTALLEENSRKIIDRWLAKAKTFSKKNLKEVESDFFGKKMSINYDKDIYEATFKTFIDRNVQLITNATSQTLTNVENIVYDAMTTGRGWEEIEGKLRQQKEIACDRIKLIARDQTSKANGVLNQIAQQEAGIEYFEWWGMDDERERPLHRKLNGKIFKWNDEYNRLPIIDERGNRGYPTQAVQCRCRALGVAILDGYTAKWNPSSESYDIVKK